MPCRFLTKVLPTIRSCIVVGMKRITKWAAKIGRLAAGVRVASRMVKRGARDGQREAGSAAACARWISRPLGAVARDPDPCACSPRGSTMRTMDPRPLRWPLR